MAATTGRKAPRRGGRGGGGRVALLLGTRKGAFLLRADGRRREWRLEGPHFLGSVVHHLVLDPRDRRTLLLAARTGHLGPTVYRSTDLGRTWKEAARPPQFAPVAGGGGRAVHHTFWLTPALPSEPGVWYAGTSPPGLFRSGDGGITWEEVRGFNDHPMWGTWTRDGKDGTPDGSKLHSVVVDPRDARHLYLGVSAGGIFESTDGGADWRPLNGGVAADFLPEKDPEFGHDPHRVALHPLDPDRLYHQNHCGLYRLDRPSDRWVRIGDQLPRSVGDIGFPVVLHPRDPDTLWVVPMDGTSVWPRTSVGGKPAVYRSRDGGRRWTRQDRGFPRRDAWWTVKRQAFAADSRSPVGLYLGTTSGEVWGSRDEGASWRCLARHLPQVHAVEAAEP